MKAEDGGNDWSLGRVDCQEPKAGSRFYAHGAKMGCILSGQGTQGQIRCICVSTFQLGNVFHLNFGSFISSVGANMA